MSSKNKYFFALSQNFILHNRYRIKDVLGVGGFGITYLGYDIYNEDLCAIKELFINDSVKREDDGVAVAAIDGKEWIFEHGIVRFMEEAEILHTLNGTAHIVKITDYFKENGTAYFVMEYIEGPTLKGLMMDYGGQIPFEEAKRIICKVGSTLKYVYDEYSIIHRDLSPDNILIDQNGDPKIIDFGNAKLYVRNTGQSHSVVLKPGFAPPEQYTGKGQGPWTDVYSLAGVFYYICTGIKVPPSTERLTGATYVPLAKVVSSCPQDISMGIDQAMNLNPAQRTQNMKAFISIFKDIKKKDGLPVLIFTDVFGKKEIWRLPLDEEVIVGRDMKMSNIAICNSTQISKQHCILKYISTKNKFEITDISTNGITCEGNKLIKDKVYYISPGTTVVLGKNICKFNIEVK